MSTPIQPTAANARQRLARREARQALEAWQQVWNDIHTNWDSLTATAKTQALRQAALISMRVARLALLREFPDLRD
jgi:hypothetical protein